ncbi:uncharacterized protein LOC109860102 [Pseudomyrmex gracilis]|uniref:uncharacterized protein LOC109860102 n=1 Tax=Pseudomyrmex gracilis TaxID=219809 RepID=UPI0009953B3A|nr:uncharacterized protein LOC109860102 [Pseudomyrmex gracilis]
MKRVCIDPNQANNNHVNSVSEALPDSGTKTFYENLPFHGIQAPPNKTDSLFNYKEHYQQQQHRQEMQQYSYPLPSNSSNQLTLPLTRNLYQSSIVSPLQTSFVHTNNIRPSTLMHREAANTGNHPPAVHQDEEQQQPPPSYGQINHDARQSSSRRHATNRRNERNRKYRNRAPSDRSKSKQNRAQRGDNTVPPPQRRNDGSIENSPARETVFRQIPDLGVPERMYKISYPHYYEDEDIAECSTEFPRLNSTVARQQQQQQPWERQSNRCVADNNTPQFASDANDAKIRGKTSKTRLSTTLDDTRKPSAPTIMQYAELHFRDVGQEIDV